MKNLYIFYLLFIPLFSAYSIPAKKNLIKKHIQSDGDTLNVLLDGDEFFKIRKTSDNIIIKRADDGFFYYALYDTINNDLIPGKLLAHNPDKRNNEEVAFINAHKANIDSFISAKKTKKRSIYQKKPQINTRSVSIPEKFKFLVLLVEFKDKSFNQAHNNELFYDMMNKEGFSYQEAEGSVVDYFKDQSSGKFIAEYDVVGPIKLSKTKSYYGDNDYYGDDKNAQQMIYDACLEADLLVDFSKYDNDGDGVLDFVYVIYAGYGEAQSNDESDIWPHFWDISNFNLKLDNTKINLYACSSELSGYKGDKLDGIGTICHESSHILGLPDMYDTSYETNNFGMGNWDIMDSGCYLNDGNTPCSYSAYERYFLGWLDPIVLDSPDQIELEALNISNKACILKSENSENEYFMIENRQRTGWDQYLPASGMLITRVNYNEKDWANNCVNNTEGKQGITIIPADNELLSYTNDEFSSSYTEYYLSMMGDTYPGKSGNTEFSSTSLPKSEFSDKTVIDKPIKNITEKNGIISFNFNNYDNIINSINIETPLSNVYSKGKEVYIENYENKPVYIYNTSGLLIKQFIPTEKIEIITLLPGNYIIKTDSLFKIITY